ncbi:archaeal proteasome endopeptidase complex subunit beta [[Eubacterium] cellulosolvens]
MSQVIPYIPGATTVGIIYRDGVLLASERRVSYGYFVMSKSARKVFKITDTIGAACAGLVSDMQILAKEASAYANIYAYENDHPISVKATAKMIGSLLFQRRLMPYITQTIIGGIDQDGPSLYVLDLLGSVLPDKYAAVGSGTEISIGVLEDEYKDNMSLDEAKDLMKRAIKAALARDAASGGDVDLLIISKEGIKTEIITLK